MSRPKNARQPMRMRHASPTGVSHDAVTRFAPHPFDPADFAPPATMSRPGRSALLDADGRVMDAAPCCDVAEFLRGQYGLGANGFLGYGTCATLSQDGLMRLGVEGLADDMVREWGKVTGPDAAACRALEKALTSLRVRELFRQAAGTVGYFGVAYLFVDTGTRDDEELMTPLTPIPAKMGGMGGIKRLVPLDPVIVSPGDYNAFDPLSPHYFDPRWYILLSRRVHASRVLKFVQHRLPLLLLPAYNFGGVPATQLALDYLVHFTGTRESAARLLNKFSLTVFKANLQGLIYDAEGAEADIVRRLKYFAKNRDNDGVELIDKEDEDIVQINTPLSGVDVIVRQALEMLAAIFHMPVTKFLGVSPGGMNATGESDTRNWYDYVGSQQVSIYGPALERLLALLQAQLLGGVNRDMAWEWRPLWTPTEREVADTDKLVADGVVALVGNGVLSPEEGRAALAKEKEGRWASLAVAPESLSGGAL